MTQPIARWNDHALTILFTDVEGSTELRSRRGDKVADEMLLIHAGIVRREIEHYGVDEVVFLGNGFMAALPLPGRGGSGAPQPSSRRWTSATTAIPTGRCGSAFVCQGRVTEPGRQLNHERTWRRRAGLVPGQAPRSALGGEISVESQPERGTRFTMTLANRIAPEPDGDSSPGLLAAEYASSP
jgi:class 3 adenylate cyclase